MEISWGAAAMFTRLKKGELSIEYVAIAVIALALIIVFFIYSGILREQLGAIMKKIISFITGR